MGTKFATIYNHFLNSITDDMYMELTPEDTIKDLQNLLIHAIPRFEFPRKNLSAYDIDIKKVKENETTDADFIIGVCWGELNEQGEEIPYVYVDNSSFEAELSSEEIAILTILMTIGWLQRQVTSVENTRMKYSGPDFKMTSQANHLSKLINLLNDCRRDSQHMQRLYGRRKKIEDGSYRSNWSVLREVSATDD